MYVTWYLHTNVMADVLVNKQDRGNGDSQLMTS